MTEIQAKYIAIINTDYEPYIRRFSSEEELNNYVEGLTSTEDVEIYEVTQKLILRIVADKQREEAKY